MIQEWFHPLFSLYFTRLHKTNKHFYTLGRAWIWSLIPVGLRQRVHGTGVVLAVKELGFLNVRSGHRLSTWHNRLNHVTKISTLCLSPTLIPIPINPKYEIPNSISISIKLYNRVFPISTFSNIITSTSLQYGSVGPCII
jgi:hypothetical protein